MAQLINSKPKDKKSMLDDVTADDIDHLMTELVLDQPFAHVLLTEKSEQFCNHCFSKKVKKLLRCSACKFAYYCSSNCQKAGWKNHKLECQRLKNSFPIAPHTETILFGRIIDRLNREGQKISLEIPDPVSNNRHWASLVSHQSDIRKDPEKMKSYDWLKKNLTEFFGSEENLPGEKDLFVIFCKKSINANGIYDNFGEMVGVGLDFRGSGYDHSCQPNIGISFNGSTVFFRALEPNTNILDRTTSFISYTELTQSKLRRQKELEKNYFFVCNCVRCNDPMDTYLTGAKCPCENCPGQVPLDEEFEISGPIACVECGSLLGPEMLIQAQNFMLEADENLKDLKEIYETDATKGVDLCDSFIQQGKRILHEKNVYLTDFMTIFVQWALCTRESNHMTCAVQYARECLPCLGLCYPKNHKILAMHLLKIVYLQILLQEKRIDWQFADEALENFGVWFGKEHRYTDSIARFLKAANLEKELASRKHDTDEPIKFTHLLRYLKFD